MKQRMFMVSTLPEKQRQLGGTRTWSYRPFILMFLLIFLHVEVSLAYYQQDEVVVTGSVTDPDGLPLPGVNVLEKGTSNGTQTDFDGNFSLEVSSSQATLVFSYLGMVTLERSAEDAPLQVTLQEDAQALDEVVVVGYGTQSRARVVSAVDQVSSEALEGRPNVNVTQALQGTSPSLVIQQRNSEPGAGININIRGISTLGDNSPLIVIDGIVGGNLNTLNPNDIESVSVLKDAGSAAIYGSRASNGVVLITTKTGKTNQPMRVEYNGMTGVNVPHFFMTPVSGYENAILRNEAAFNSGQSAAVYTPEQIREFYENGDEQWFAEEIVQEAIQHNHNLSVSGGTENSSYLVSVGYLDQASNFVGPDKGLKRYNYRINLNNEYGKFRLNSNLSYTKQRITDHAGTTGRLMADANRVPLYFRQKDDEGNYLTNDVLQQFNSLGILEQGGFRKYDYDEVFGNLNAEYAFNDNFKLRGVFGGRFFSDAMFERIMRVDYLPKGVSGEDQNTNDTSRKGLQLNTQLLAEYSQTFADVHDLDILIGVSNENYEDRGIGLFKRYTDPDLGTPITDTEIGENSYNSNQSSSKNSLNSLFGRASYAFDDKYFAEFSFRYDGSSKFREDLRWGFFPSASLGYQISQEDFMQGYRDAMGNLKLRASYGILGNQNVGNFQYQTTYSTFQNAYGFNNSGVGGTAFNFANPDIEWEKAATFNVGVDAEFFNRALSVSFDYFDKVTSDILVPPAVPGVFGTSLPDYNAGKVGSRGWELSAAYRHYGEHATHRIGFNIGDSQNEVLDFQGEERLNRLEELQILLREGQPFNSYVGLKRIGIFQNMEEIENAAVPSGLNVQPGDNRYLDINGDGIIDDNDKVIFGNPFPRYTFGFNYDLQVGGFDASIFLQGVGKRTMMLRGELIEAFHSNYGMTMYEHQLDYWTPQNPDAYYPRIANSGTHSIENNFKRGSDMLLYDGAYLRVKNIQIGYSLPQNVVESMGMTKFRTYLTGQNLLTFSKVDFVDPEISEFDSNLRQSGANSGRAYPTMVYFGLGLDLIF